MAGFHISDDYCGYLIVIGLALLIGWFFFEVIRVRFKIWGKGQDKKSDDDTEYDDYESEVKPAKPNKNDLLDNLGEPLLDPTNKGTPPSRAKRSSTSSKGTRLSSSPDKTDRRISRSLSRIDHFILENNSSNQRPRKITSSIPFTFYQTKFLNTGQVQRQGTPLRRYLISFQIMIQLLSLISTELASSANTNDHSNNIGTLFTDSSLISHVIKMSVWLLVLLTDIIRGNASRCSWVLPCASGLFAVSASGTIEVS